MHASSNPEINVLQWVWTRAWTGEDFMSPTMPETAVDDLEVDRPTRLTPKIKATARSIAFVFSGGPLDGLVETGNRRIPAHVVRAGHLAGQPECEYSAVSLAPHDWVVTYRYRRDIAASPRSR